MHCSGSNKITDLSLNRMQVLTRNSGKRLNGRRYEPRPNSIGGCGITGITTGNHLTKKIVPVYSMKVYLKQQRPDIDDLLADNVPAPPPKYPGDNPLRLFQRYTRWCLSLGRQDFQNRKLARRFLKLMKGG